MKEKRPSHHYDLIGDIHGYAEDLVSLLEQLGYRPNHAGIYEHPQGRCVIFLGDLIDRGPAIRRTLAIAKGMVDAGHAEMVLGNHEYNAIAFHTMDDRGIPLREHSERNLDQTKETTEQFADHPDEWAMYIDWFKTLPFALDKGQFFVVHAAWSEAHLEVLKDRRLTDRDLLLATATKGTPEWLAVEYLLKGAEIPLPEGEFFYDKAHHARRNIRTKWWLDLRDRTYREAVFPECESLTNALIDPAVLDPAALAYPKDGLPVFIGHYWLEETTPRPFGNIVCLDYSVAKSGYAAAYRWGGRKPITTDNYFLSK